MTLFGARIRPLLYLGALAVLAGPGAQTPLAAQTPTAKAAKRLRAGWELSQFTWVKLVPAEAGAAGSQHPIALDFQALSTQLGAIRLMRPDGVEPLFSDDELNNLRKPLCEAFAAARPDEDVLVLSTNRRSNDPMKEPKAITARMFWREDALQVIVHDARLAFFLHYRTTGLMPDFVFGSRNTPGEPRIQLPGGGNPREDWVQVSLAPGAVAATLAASRPPAPVPPAPAPPVDRSAFLPPPVVARAAAPAATSAAARNAAPAAAKAATSAAVPAAATSATLAAAQATAPSATLAAAPAAAPSATPAAAPAALRAANPAAPPAPLSAAAPAAVLGAAKAAAPVTATAAGQAASSAATSAAAPAAAPTGEAARFAAWQRRLRALKQLRSEDLITEAEYQQKCQQLLNEL
jgi:hypothetical protein